VNGLVDPSQQSYYADSVLSLALKIGIPAWIVEIRHDATHNALPPLAVLRNAAAQMLQWLGVNYWQQQILHLETLSGNA
jgi:ribosomal biogenesis protein LAS1